MPDSTRLSFLIIGVVSEHMRHTGFDLPMGKWKKDIYESVHSRISTFLFSKHATLLSLVSSIPCVCVCACISPTEMYACNWSVSFLDH